MGFLGRIARWKPFLVVFGSLGHYLRFAENELRYQGYRRAHCLPKNFTFNGFDTRFIGGGRVRVKDGGYIGANSFVATAPGADVTLGKSVRISHNVNIYAANNKADQDFSKPRLTEKRRGLRSGTTAGSARTRS